MVLFKKVRRSFLLVCFLSSPGLAQPAINVTDASGERQHWLRKSTSISTEKESAIFYENTEDPAKILIFLGKQIYLLDTNYPAVLRVTSTLPEAGEALETGEIATEALYDEMATVQHVMGTPDFAGNMYWLGWMVCFWGDGKADPGHPLGCHLFARLEGYPVSRDNKRNIPPPLSSPMSRLNPINIPEKVQQLKLIRKVDPYYPEDAKSEHLSGKVILSITIDEEGNVTDIKITSGHPLLVEAAKAAVSRWKYSPTLLNGEPVPVITTITLNFSYTPASGETAVSIGE